MQLNLEPVEKIAIRWGDFNSVRIEGSSLLAWIMMAVRIEFPTIRLPENYKYHELIRSILYAHSPRVDESIPGNISVFQSLADYERARRTSLKAGKFFRKVFPDLSDNSVSNMVDAFKRKWIPAELTFRVGSDRKDFGLAYSGEIGRTENISISGIKNLANSCMRHSFSRLDCHPAEAYASGDFAIAIVQEKESGNIAGRCVIQIRQRGKELTSPICAPVYAVSDNAAKLITTHLDSIGAKKGKHLGARLLSIEHNGGYIMPYVDNGPDYAHDAGRYLILSDSGDIETQVTQGVSREREMQVCSGCRQRLCDDDCFLTEDGRGPYCEDCYHDLVTVCDVCRDECARSDISPAFRMESDRRNEIHVCEYCARRLFVETENGELWLESDCEEIEIDEESVWVDPISYHNRFVRCEHSESWIRREDAAILFWRGRSFVVHVKYVNPDHWQETDALRYIPRQDLFDLGADDAIPGICIPDEPEEPEDVE